MARVSCQKLRVLYADSAAISDAGLAGLAKIKSLEVLSLGGVRITDIGLQKLSAHKQFRELILNDIPGITDTGMVALKDMEIQILNLTHAHLGDKGLAHLAKIKGLKALFICRTNVTLKGVRDFCSQVKNVEINIAGCPMIDASEVERLRAEFPKVTITDRMPEETDGELITSFAG